MNLALLVYIITTALPALQDILEFSAFILVAALLGGLLRNGFCRIEFAEKYEELACVYPTKTRYYFLLAFFILSCNLIPNKDTCYAMLAAYGVESIVTNPEVQKLGGKSLDVLNKAMDEYLEEGKPAIPVSPEKVEK